MKKQTIALIIGLSLLATPALARDTIRIVGSSTVYPFTTVVAEHFAKATKFKAPIVESTGTGGGMKLFCAGVGSGTPDATDASRMIKDSEWKQCRDNGVLALTEMKIGIDGIVLVQSKNGPKFSLTMDQVFLALAREVPGKDGKLIPNPYKKWSDIDSSLPQTAIEVLGPPPTSGTRDSFHELFMEVGAKKIPAMKALPKDVFEKAWKSMREDGAYIEAGENDNLIIQKLTNNKNAVGVFGFSYLDNNTNVIRGVAIDNIEPTYENISTGKYEGARPLFVYFKNQHFGAIPGLKEFLDTYYNKKTIGPDGYLADKGLVPLPQLAPLRNIGK